MKKALLLCCIALTGCASGLTQISENEYMISDYQYWSWSAENVMKDVLVNASTICKNKGRKMHMLDYTLGQGQNRAATVHFECLEIDEQTRKDSPTPVKIVE